MNFSAKIFLMLDLVFSAEGGSPPKDGSASGMTPIGGKNNIFKKSPGEKFFREVLDIGIKELKIKDKNIEVSLNLVGEDKIKALNKKYRGKNNDTDVLSFPLKESRLKKYDILPLGDIFICLPFAVKESKRQNIGLEKELAWLTVHGFLHLLGYDHEKSKQGAEKMFKLESRILSKLNSYLKS